jgi:hypothetical protein
MTSQDLIAKIDESKRRYDLQALREEYAPHYQFAEFQIGYTDYILGRSRNPFGLDGVACQSWDRGAECAMRAKTAGLI